MAARAGLETDDRLESLVPEFEHSFGRQLPPTLATVGHKRCERYTESCGGDETKHVATRRFDSVFDPVH